MVVQKNYFSSWSEIWCKNALTKKRAQINNIKPFMHDDRIEINNPIIQYTLDLIRNLLTHENEEPFLYLDLENCNWYAKILIIKNNK